MMNTSIMDYTCPATGTSSYTPVIDVFFKHKVCRDYYDIGIVSIINMAKANEIGNKQLK